MSLGEIIAAIVAAGGVTWPVVRSLLGYWAKTLKENEDLKAKNAALTMQRLEDEGKSFRISIDTITRKIEEHTASLQRNHTDNEAMKAQLTDMRNRLDMYTKSFTDNLKNVIRSEVIQLGKEARMLKDKKNGTGT